MRIKLLGIAMALGLGSTGLVALAHEDPDMKVHHHPGEGESEFEGPDESGSGAADKALSPEDKSRREKVLVTFKGGQLTVGDLEDAIEDQSPLLRKRYMDPEHQKKLLEKRVRFALLAQEAEKRGYSSNDTVVQAVKQNAVQNLVKTEFDDKMSPEAVAAEDIAAYYEEHKSEFMRAAQRRASQVVFKTKQEALDALDKIKAMDMRQFRQFTREKSVDEASKLRGGDLRYFTADGTAREQDGPAVDKALAKSIFGLQNVGDTTDKPVKMATGFALAKMTGQRPANERSLAQADETIRVRLWREGRQAAIEKFVSELRTRHKTVVQPQLVDKIRFDKLAVPKGKGIPAGFPAAKDVVQQAH